MDITDFSPQSLLNNEVSYSPLSKQQQKRLHIIAEYYRLSTSHTGIRALFTGENGAGKTIAVKVLAQRLSLALLRANVSLLASKYIGETEKNLDRILVKAEEAETILLFDEADALFSKRSDVNDAHDRYENTDIHYLLERLENFIGIAVIATNYTPELTDTIRSRCKYIIDFPLPKK